MTLRLPPQPVGVRTPSAPALRTTSSPGVRAPSGSRTQTIAQAAAAPPAQQTAVDPDAPPPSRFSQGGNSNPETHAEQIRSGADSRRSMAGIGARTRALTFDLPAANAALGSNSSPSLASVRNGTASLARGQSGDGVRTAQEHLRARGYDSPADGRFGPATERAVQSFQVDEGLEASGRVDRPTLGALEGTPPTDAVPEPVAAPTVEGGGREMDVARAEHASGATLARHADVAHSLTDRHAVGELISRTPQLDGNARTSEDRSRCGGAAVLNGLLLDGNPDANATAIERTATDLHTDPTSDESAALRAMHGGTLTPPQAQQLQGLLNRMADGVTHEAADRPGTTTHEVGALVAGLEAHGGFAHTRDLSLDVERIHPSGGGEVYHWTVSSQTTDGQTARADSWPNEGGYASVRGGIAPARDFQPGTTPSPDFEGQVFLDRTLAGSTTSVVGRVHNADGHVAGAPRDGFVGDEYQRGAQPLSRHPTTFGDDGNWRD